MHKDGRIPKHGNAIFFRWKFTVGTHDGRSRSGNTFCLFCQSSRVVTRHAGQFSELYEVLLDRTMIPPKPEKHLAVVQCLARGLHCNRQLHGLGTHVQIEDMAGCGGLSDYCINSVRATVRRTRIASSHHVDR
ncbi:hypothetical protein VTK56DRAFT_8777 [Thermocarpiscus australiensis]